MASAEVPEHRGALEVALFYGLVLLGAALIYYLVRQLGLELEPPSVLIDPPKKAAPLEHSDTLYHVLLALTVIILASRCLSRVFSALGQPPVIGEVIAGICLGPSLLGRALPDASVYILPPTIAPFLSTLAQVGVLLYMFIVGLELDAESLKKKAHTSVAISHASIIFPFVLGAMLALILYTELAGPGVRFTEFSLFLGVAMSITAFPVLARILTDRGLSRTRLGTIALACAAADDVTAWCLLAIVVGIARADVHSAFGVLAGTAAYIGAMLLLVRPWLRRFSAGYEQRHLDQTGISIILLALLLSSLATELIGIHAIFGAFLIGALVPHHSQISREFSHRLEAVVSVLLLPAFFAYTGMRTQIGLLDAASEWALCGFIICIATVGKFGGTYLAARFCSMPKTDAAALGLLMNTRGLMELIVLNIGLDLGIISPKLFAMMVLMAIVTTIITTPLLNLLLRNDPRLKGGEIGG